MCQRLEEVEHEPLGCCFGGTAEPTNCSLTCSHWNGGRYISLVRIHCVVSYLRVCTPLVLLFRQVRTCCSSGNMCEYGNLLHYGEVLDLKNARTTNINWGGLVVNTDAHVHLLHFVKCS